MKTKTIAVHFPAGGTAKTTTTWALASYLALKFRVLAIDLDPQATLTKALIDEADPLTAYDVLKRQEDIEDAIVPTSPNYPDKLFVLTSSTELSGLEVETAAQLDRHYILADALEPLIGFDFILVDTPPNSGINSVASLTGSHVLVPVETSPKAWDQISRFDNLYSQVKRRINPCLEILGVVPTKFEQTILAAESLEALKDRFPDLITNPIHKTVRLPETMAQGYPPWFQKKSDDYLKLTNKLLRRLNYEKEILTPDT